MNQIFDWTLILYAQKITFFKKVKIGKNDQVGRIRIVLPYRMVIQANKVVIRYKLDEYAGWSQQWYVKFHP